MLRRIRAESLVVELCCRAGSAIATHIVERFTEALTTGAVRLGTEDMTAHGASCATPTSPSIRYASATNAEQGASGSDPHQ